jgi:hypothetical protein
MKKKWIAWIPLVMVGMLVFAAVGGGVVRLLWNWLMPDLFGWSPITFWQALGLLALCRILFGGLGRHGGSGSSSRRHMAERWERMTPEERERVRQGWRGRLGLVPPAGESKEI